MAIKSGNIIHDVHGFVIDRVQSAGGSIDVPTTKIDELGNYESVATIRDIPDLQFNLESFDASTEIEALICGFDPTTTSAGQAFDFRNAKEFGIRSPFKSGTTFTVNHGVILPWLTLESASYSFGLADNATQTFNFRGDSIFYVPGSPRYEEFTVIDEGPYTLTDDPAIKFTQAGNSVYALSVVLVDSVTKNQRRLKAGADYASTATTLTLTADPVADFDTIRVYYGSTDADTFNQTVHQGVSVKPAAVRGKDIDIYVANTAGTVWTRWTSVQSFSADWSVSLESDEEFGNTERVSYGYSDTPATTGSIGVKPRDASDLWEKLSVISGIPTTDVIGTQAAVALPVRAVVREPNTANVMKTLTIPKARFKVPSLEPSVNQKLEVSFEFESDDGVMTVTKGMPA